MYTKLSNAKVSAKRGNVLNGKKERVRKFGPHAQDWPSSTMPGFVWFAMVQGATNCRVFWKSLSVSLFKTLCRPPFEPSNTQDLHESTVCTTVYQHTVHMQLEQFGTTFAMRTAVYRWRHLSTRQSAVCFYIALAIVFVSFLLLLDSLEIKMQNI